MKCSTIAKLHIKRGIMKFDGSEISQIFISYK